MENATADDIWEDKDSTTMFLSAKEYMEFNSEHTPCQANMQQMTKSLQFSCRQYNIRKTDGYQLAQQG